MKPPVLPPDELQRLKDDYFIREAIGYELLWARMAALRAAGWPLSTLSEALGVSRQTPANWADRAVEFDLPLPTVPAPPPRPIPQETLKIEAATRKREARDRIEKEVLARNLPRLLALQPQAEALRGPSSASPDRAAASAEYTMLIDRTLRGGVRGRVLAEALGVQVITLNARLRRAGLRKNPPSQSTPSWSQTEAWQEGA